MRGDAVGAQDGGKLNPVDVLAVGRVGIRESVKALLITGLEGRMPEVGFLLGDRDDVPAGRSDEQRLLCRLRADLADDFEIPADGWLRWNARRPAQTERSTRIRIVRRLVRSTRADVRVFRRTEVEIAALRAAPLLAEVGCETLTAGKLIGKVAGADGYAAEAEFVRPDGGAPVSATSDRRDRRRLDRGNPQLDCALVHLGVNKERPCSGTKVCLGGKQAAGSVRMGTLRCFMRHLARRVRGLLTDLANGLESSLALT